jgi:hypothetical protein
MFSHPRRPPEIRSRMITTFAIIFWRSSRVTSGSADFMLPNRPRSEKRPVSTHKEDALHTYNKPTNFAGPCLFLAMTMLAPAIARATPLSIQLTPATQSVASGGVAVFEAIITNNSGSTLDAAADLFLNFDNFNPDILTPTQLLGTPDFSIPNGTTSAKLDLFSVLVSALPKGGTASIDTVLEDVNGDLSDPTTATITPAQTTAAPECGTLLLTGAAFLTLGLVRRRAWLRGKQLCGLAPLLLLPALALSVKAQVPSFSTRSPTTASLSEGFEVLLPIANSGESNAASVEITSAELSSGGISVASVRQPAQFPLSVGSLAAGASYLLDLRFDKSALGVGKPYLVTVRGTYSLNGGTLGFVVNRPVVYTASSPFGGPGNPVTVTPVLDSAHMGTKLFVAGLAGTLSTTGADGTVFTLAIPANALLGNELITMTPVSSLAGAPVSGGLLAAVQLEPDGLQFLAPATLTIQPPSDIPIDQQIGLSYEAGGQDLAQAPLANSNTITFNVIHFTGYEVGKGSLIQPLAPASTLAQLQNEVAQLLQQTRNCAVTGSGCDPQMEQQLDGEIKGLEQLFFDQVVVPLLQQALTDYTVAFPAVQTAIAWLRQVIIMNPAEGPLPEPFQTDSDYVNQTIPKIYVNAFKQIGQLCIATSDSSERADYATKLLSIVRSFEITYGGAEKWLPSNYTNITEACIVGPLTFDFDSEVSGSQIQPGLALAETSHVQAQGIRLKPDSAGNYPASGATLDYLDFTLSNPGYCSLSTSTNNGTVDVSGVFDLNLFADPHPNLLLTLVVKISEEETVGELTAKGCVPIGPFGTGFYEENLVVAHTPDDPPSYRILVNSNSTVSFSGTTVSNGISTAKGVEKSTVGLNQTN